MAEHDSVAELKTEIALSTFGSALTLSAVPMALTCDLAILATCTLTTISILVLKYALELSLGVEKLSRNP